MLAPALRRLDVHAARESDLAAAIALVTAEQQKNPWMSRVPDFVRGAVADPVGEHRACVAERDSEIVGLGIYGMLSGALGTGMIHSVLVAPRSRRAGIGLRIVDHAAMEMKSAGARIIIAELPGDTVTMRYRALLISFGFVEETRIDDYYRDGTPQIISRLDIHLPVNGRP